MILTVLALGGTILGATAIAGLLMLHQIRQTTDLANSAKAIFAADSGIEWALFNVLCTDEHRVCPIDSPQFQNGASAAVTCEDSAGDPVDNCNDPDVVNVRSVGSSGTASRAFQASF